MKKMKKAYGWQYRSSSLCPAGIEPAFQAPEACALSIGLRTRSAGWCPGFFPCSVRQTATPARLRLIADIENPRRRALTISS